MKRAFLFVHEQNKEFKNLLGYPTIKMYEEYTEVYYDTKNTIRDLDKLTKAANQANEFRLFENDGLITIYFTFYNVPFENVDNESKD